jgi:hypothetical protein
MENLNQIEIQLSKAKLVLMLLGSLVFVGLGIWFVLNPEQFQDQRIGNPIFVFIIGLSSILFFGLGVIIFIKKLFDKSPGLRISEMGIIYQFNVKSRELIPWTDILEIGETKIVNQTFLNIILKNPQKYIDSQKSTYKKKAMQLNYNLYGTVIAITTNGLKCSHKELKSLLENKFTEFKNKN